MSILWEIFEISVNFFQGFILVFFPYYYLEDKKKRKFYKSPGIAYAIIIATTISIMNKLKSFEHFYAIIYVAIIFVYSFKHLHGTVLKKIFTSVFPSLVMATISVFTANLFSILYNVSPEQVITENGMERCLAVISTQILIICVIILSLKIIKKAIIKTLI
ncbi:hypothetical protein [Pseudoruminococcus massiliensis]|uniref:hypothetical protein n=1 Tax=Pseudoruminococcus massiliensis TaxID=2086583 RepID=UPI00307B4C93